MEFWEKPHARKTRTAFDAGAVRTKTDHWTMTPQQVADLQRKYADPVWGEVGTWDIFTQLGRVIDPTDRQLYCVSQLVHTYQVYQAMKADGVKDEVYLVTGLVHDLGKLLILAGERPEFVACDNGVIEGPAPECGLHNCVLHWNHDDFGYDRLKHLLPDDMAWLVKYHSINGEQARPFMCKKDRALADRLLADFKKYDKLTKSVFDLPKVDDDEVRRLLEKHVGPKIVL